MEETLGSRVDGEHEQRAVEAGERREPQGLHQGLRGEEPLGRQVQSDDHGQRRAAHERRRAPQPLDRRGLAAQHEGDESADGEHVDAARHQDVAGRSVEDLKAVVDEEHAAQREGGDDEHATERHQTTSAREQEHDGRPHEIELLLHGEQPELAVCKRHLGPERSQRARDVDGVGPVEDLNLLERLEVEVAPEARKVWQHEEHDGKEEVVEGEDAEEAPGVEAPEVGAGAAWRRRGCS
jgi:hypothetical protein